MITNSIVKKDSLPVDSKEKHIRNNSMKLYIYLLYISSLNFDSAYGRKHHIRQFQQKDFNINKIRVATGLDPKTILKYWEKLEHDNIIHYNGTLTLEEKEDCKTWKDGFKMRKKHPDSYYIINKPDKYRIIPTETIDKILHKFLVTELEFKIYLLLANIQEVTYHKNEPNFCVGYGDIIEMLDIAPHKNNRIAILKALYWLKEIDLIDFDIEQRKIGNFNKVMNVFKIKTINYYTNGGVLEYEFNKEDKTTDEQNKDKILEKYNTHLTQISV